MSEDRGWFVEQAARARQQRQRLEVQAAVPSQSEPVRFARTKTNVGSTKPSVTACRSKNSTTREFVQVPSGVIPNPILRQTEDPKRSRAVALAWRAAQSRSSLIMMAQAAVGCPDQPVGVELEQNATPAVSQPAVANMELAQNTVPAASQPAVKKCGVAVSAASRHKKCPTTGKRRNCCTCAVCFATAKALCKHKVQKHVCKKCKGVSLCPHSKVRHRCIECMGSGICSHKKERWRCKQCRTHTQ